MVCWQVPPLGTSSVSSVRYTTSLLTTVQSGCSLSRWRWEVQEYLKVWSNQLCQTIPVCIQTDVVGVNCCSSTSSFIAPINAEGNQLARIVLGWRFKLVSTWTKTHIESGSFHSCESVLHLGSVQVFSWTIFLLWTILISDFLARFEISPSLWLPLSRVTLPERRVRVHFTWTFTIWETFCSFLLSSVIANKRSVLQLSVICFVRHCRCTVYASPLVMMQDHKTFWGPFMANSQTKAITCVISVVYAAWLLWFDNIFGPLDTRPLSG